MRWRSRLDAAISAVCPIHGTSGGTGPGNPPRIDFRPEATAQQRADAQAVVDAFDFSEAAQQQWEEDRHPERKTLRQAAAQAVQDNQDFLALGPAATAAQVVAQVRRLSQQNNALIRRLIQLD